MNKNVHQILKNFEQNGVDAKVSLHPKGISRASLHTKAYIIDSKIAYVGGDNVDNPPEGDLLVGIEGMIVAALLNEFDSAYLSGEIKGKHRLTPGMDLTVSHANCTPAIEKSYGIPVEMSLLSKEGIPWLGKYYENDADQAMFAAIDAATEEVKIVSPNFNDRNVWNSIIAAARRGVKVKILIPQTYLTFPSLIDRATNMAFIRFRDLHKESTAQNIELRWFSTDGVHKEQNHAKYISVDGVWAYVGSQNFDNQSFSFSREMGIGIDSRRAVTVLDDEVFDRFWLTSFEAHSPFWVRWLPAPSANWLHRIARITLPPMMLIEKGVEWVKSFLLKNGKIKS